MITLSSDFGWPYPAAMRGVLATESNARLVDISHEFPRGDIHTAAFWVREVVPYFPPAVHLVVVDPEVGTDRAVLVIRAGEHALVGPDNGVLVPAARRVTETYEAFELREHDAESTTFHGRDVFAPLAARVHDRGIDELSASRELRPCADVREYRFPTPDIEGETARGEVIVVDGFGNAITNIPGTFLASRFGESVEIDGRSVVAERSYARVDEHEPLLTVGSHGNVELAVRGGRGDRAFGLSRGDTFTLVV